MANMDDVQHWCEEHTDKTAAGWWLSVAETLPMRCQCCERQATWMLVKAHEKEPG